MRLKDKVVLVTAAGQGIGRAAALAMAAEGATVWATDLNSTLLRQIEGTPNIRTAVLDVRDKDAIQGIAETVGAVDALFNCAGYVHAGTILEATDDDFAFAMSLNVQSHFWMIQALLPAMLDRSRGSIINMASVASSVRGLPNRCVYGVSKAAVIGLTKSVAADYVGRGIRCNAICPGTVDTPSLGDRINAYDDPIEARKQFVARQPMGRLAKPEEIAPLVVFLSSDESTFTTGNVYSIDGGMTI